MGTVHGAKWKNSVEMWQFPTNHSNVVVSISGMVQRFILKVYEKIGKL